MCALQCSSKQVYLYLSKILGIILKEFPERKIHRIHDLTVYSLVERTEGYIHQYSVCVMLSQQSQYTIYTYS